MTCNTVEVIFPAVCSHPSTDMGTDMGAFLSILIVHHCPHPLTGGASEYSEEKVDREGKVGWGVKSP